MVERLVVASEAERFKHVPIYRFVEPRLGRRRLRDWRGRALRITMLLLAVIVVCAVGLALLDNSTQSPTSKLLQGIWNAVNLVTTLGDFSPFDSRQKTFMLLTMLGVMMVGAYAVSQLTGILSSPHVVAYRENLQMEHTLRNLSGHAVVLGFLGLGKLLAEKLRKEGQQVVVIERDDVNATLASDMGYLVVKGDAITDDGVLHAARIDTARGLFVATGDENRNLTLTLMSHTLNANLRIVVKAENERWGEMLRRAGATDVIIADRLLAEAMLGEIRGEPAAGG